MTNNGHNCVQTVSIFNNVKQDSQGCIVLVELNLMTLAALSSKCSRLIFILRFCSFKLLCKTILHLNLVESLFSKERIILTAKLLPYWLRKGIFSKVFNEYMVFLLRHGGSLERMPKNIESLLLKTKQYSLVFATKCFTLW